MAPNSSGVNGRRTRNFVSFGVRQDDPRALWRLSNVERELRPERFHALDFGELIARTKVEV